MSQQALGSAEQIRAIRDEQRRVKKELDFITTKKLELKTAQNESRLGRKKWVEEKARAQKMEADEAELASQVEAFYAQNISPAEDADFRLILERRKDLQNKLAVQHALVEEKEFASYEAEQARDLVELVLGKVIGKEPELRAKADLLQRERAVVAQYRVDGAVAVTDGFLANRESKIASLRTQAKEMEDKAIKQIEQGKAARSKAKERIRDRRRELLRVRKGLEVDRQKKHAKRAKAFLQLKKSTAKAMAELKGDNERAQHARERREKKEREEFDSILADGGNPYEVFRRRQLDKQYNVKEKAAVKKQHEAELKIAERMVKEEMRTQKRETIEHQHKQYAKKYRDEKGRHITEARTEAYLRSVTIGGKDMVDPTGRVFRIQPSSETTIKTHAFGLGKVALDRPDIVDMIDGKAENKGVAIDERRVPAPYVNAHEGGNRGRGHEMDTDDLLGNDQELPGMQVSFNMDAGDRDTFQGEAYASAATDDGVDGPADDLDGDGVSATAALAESEGRRPMPKIVKDETGKIVQRDLTVLEKKCEWLRACVLACLLRAQGKETSFVYPRILILLPFAFSSPSPFPEPNRHGCGSQEAERKHCGKAGRVGQRVQGCGVHRRARGDPVQRL